MKLETKRIGWVSKWALLAISAVVVGGFATTGTWFAYDALRSSAPKVVISVPVDLRALARDPGPVYDRRPVTASPSPVPTPSPTPVPAGGSGYVAVPYVPPADEPYRLVVDSIGVNAPVVGEGVDANGVPLVPHNGYQVAWYYSTSAPGGGDNAVFAAHVTWNGVAVFYNLHLINIGDEIRIDGDDGSRMIYTVTDSFLVDPNDPSSIQVMRPTGYDAITLISCDGTFFADGSFGDYTNRRVIRGKLVEKDLPSGGQPASSP